MRRLAISLLLVVPFVAASAQIVVEVDKDAFGKHALTRPAPIYPPIARAARVSGVVVLQIQIGHDGHVISTKPVSGPPMLIPAAIDAVKQWTFRPFLKNGVPIAASGQVTITFELPPEPPKTPIQEFMERVHARYVSQPFLAVFGFTCEYQPAWKEFPQIQDASFDSPVTRGLSATRLVVKVKPPSPATVTTTQESNPGDSVQLPPLHDAIYTAKQLAEGFFPTWVTLALNGPGATPDAELVKTEDGYLVTMTQRGQTVQLRFDRDLLLQRITQTSANQTLNEIPEFTQTPSGLLFTGSETELRRDSAVINIKYDLTYQKVGHYELPQVVHLRVNDDLNVHLTFTNCEVSEAPIPPPPGKVIKEIQIGPPR